MSDVVWVAIVSSVFMAVFAIGVGLFLRLRNDVEDLQRLNRALAQRLSLFETDLIDAKRSQTISQAAQAAQAARDGVDTDH